MNSDEREGLKRRRLKRRIEKTLATMRRMEHDDIHAHAYVRDVTKLLSLLDSQAESIELLQKIPAVANDALNMTLGQIVNDVATRMRDLCVEKVRELAADYSTLSLSEWWNKYEEERLEKVIIPALQSLTLDQVEEKQ